MDGRLAGDADRVGPGEQDAPAHQDVPEGGRTSLPCGMFRLVGVGLGVDRSCRATTRQSTQQNIPMMPDVAKGDVQHGAGSV